MRLYIAGPYEDRARCRKIAARLRTLGHDISARWLTEDDTDPTVAAERDLDDICASDGVLVAANGNTGRGMWVEMGYALCLPISIYFYGPDYIRDGDCPVNYSVFTHLPGVTRIKRLTEVPK